MVTIKEIPALDAAADAGTLYFMPYFVDRLEGTLAGREDEDWIAIELTAGETYDIALAGRGETPSADTILTLYNAAGEQLAHNDDIDLDAGNRYSMLTFTPDSDGTYYISAAAYTRNPAQDNSGGYAVTVSARRGEGLIDSYRDAETGVDATLAADAAAWALEGSAHDDALTGNDEANWLFGHGGQHNALRGGGGDDWLYAGTGFNTLEGGPGADVLVGHADPNPDYGARFEWAAYTASPEGVTVHLHDGTAQGGDAAGDTLHGIDGVIGSAHADTLTGNRLGNELWGGPGDDILDGGGLSPGHWDYLEGGPGADTLIGSARADAGNTTFAGYRQSLEGVTVHLHDSTAQGGDAAGDTFEGINSLMGSAHADNLAGNGGANVLAGGDGPDRLAGSAGDDVLYGDHLSGQRGGDDVLDGGPGNDWLRGGPGADTLTGGAGRDTASYQGSNAGVVVRLHNASARGGEAKGDTFAELLTVEYTDAAGNVRTEQVPDIEDLHGSAYADVLAGDSRANILLGRGGHDVLYGGPGGGDDTLHGGPGDDALYGGRGDDLLSGEAGADTLYGGADNDTLYGGMGDDTFVFAPGHGDDAIRDFGHGTDRIDLSAFDEIEALADLALAQTDRGVVIDLSAHGGETITLEGYYHLAMLTEADFIF